MLLLPTDAQISSEHGLNAVSLLVWISKALVLRGHPLGQECVSRLFGVFVIENLAQVRKGGIRAALLHHHGM